jgi:predicted  nucleic acid-binding Zn-ribbon protein
MKENEVNLEMFLKLKEIDSLNKMRISHLNLIQEQNERIAKLNNRLQEASLQTAKLKQELIQSNDKLAETEKKLTVATTQKQHLLDLGGDEKKIELFQVEINRCEDEGLNLLSEVERIESEIGDNKTFVAGVEKTIHEISEEARPLIEESQQELKNIDLRVVLLQEELPDDFRSILIKVTNKNLAHGPFTRIEQGSCFFCRYKISRMDESEIDMQKGLKTCPQCQRIFLPYGS